MSPAPVSDRPSLPRRAGIGLKLEHAPLVTGSWPEIGFFEVHAENFMGAGGPAHRLLAAVAERYPLSLHGVALSIGSAGPLDRDHLARLRALCDRYRPASFSEHLAWSSHDGVYLNDLLPVAYDGSTLDLVCAHVDEVQGFLGRRMLLENPSTYVGLAASTMSELEFLGEVVRRTGCGLLLDVNNVHVSATNRGFDPVAYLDAFPVAHVGEVHLAGAAPDTDDSGAALLIDAHDRPVGSAVWALFRRLVDRIGPVPTLIEWDNDVPTLDRLVQEMGVADEILARAGARIAA